MGQLLAWLDEAGCLDQRSVGPPGDDLRHRVVGRVADFAIVENFPALEVAAQFAGLEASECNAEFW